MSVRVRQHVNPLSAKFQQPLVLPDWGTCYADLQRPLHLDIGSARGTFLLELAQQRSQWNFLGTEIRSLLVEEANDRCQALQLRNLHYLYCNINYHGKELLAALPPGVLQYVSVQFPDPWFKKRHQKRRVLQPELLRQLIATLQPQGHLFLQSDVEEVILDMVHQVEQHPQFHRTHSGWLGENPLPVPTERERSVLRRDLPVYRVLYVKTT